MLTAELLRQQVHYDQETGQFTRKVATGGRYRAVVGAAAGAVCKESGYVKLSVFSKQYRAHRLAWLWMTGNWPVGEVDHANGKRNDNRWSNLRDVAPAVNRQNQRRAMANSKTGLLGASWSTRDQRFVARIKANGKYLSLGCFNTAEAAHQAYLTAKRNLHVGCTL